MPTFDVIATVRFHGVKAADEEELEEMIDNAMGDGAVLFKNPTTGEEIASEYDITENQ